MIKLTLPRQTAAGAEVFVLASLHLGSLLFYEPKWRIGKPPADSFAPASTPTAAELKPRFPEGPLQAFDDRLKTIVEQFDAGALTIDVDEAAIAAIVDGHSGGEDLESWASQLAEPMADVID